MTDSSIEEKHETAPEAKHQEALPPAVPDDSNNAPVPEQRMTIQNFFAFLVRVSFLRLRAGFFLKL